MKEKKISFNTTDTNYCHNLGNYHYIKPWNQDNDPEKGLLFIIYYS